LLAYQRQLSQNQLRSKPLDKRYRLITAVDEQSDNEAEAFS
jgi:hypothetical protein